MFGIDSTELAVIALVALLVIGPKDLPRVMRSVGNWVARGRAMTRHVRSGFDAMMREAELEEMQKVWAQQNEAIMKATALDTSWSEPAFDAPATEAPAFETIAPEAVPETGPETPEAPPAKPRKRRAKAKAASETPADTSAVTSAVTGP